MHITTAQGIGLIKNALNLKEDEWCYTINCSLCSEQKGHFSWIC
jgi:hypothetical protein